jgi:AcrR family transcriptional regulator
MTEELATREKIIKIARNLFAVNGFDGTSVRDIATSAEVNVAAISYHFHSKDGLYKEVLKTCFNDASFEIRNIFEQNNVSTPEFAVLLFKHFIIKRDDLLSTFKMFMSENVPHPEEFETDDAMIGPPGGAVLMEALKKDIKKELSDEDLLWAVTTIFNNIIHSAIAQVCCISKRPQLQEIHSQARVEARLRRLVNVVLTDLKK